uniref:Cystatin domain-containing protein n=1 Tax=Strongyloides stercoralis TaxID=6248 RepID=A0A0K0E2Y2_STRER
MLFNFLILSLIAISNEYLSLSSKPIFKITIQWMPLQISLKETSIINLGKRGIRAYNRNSTNSKIKFIKILGAEKNGLKPGKGKKVRLTILVENKDNKKKVKNLAKLRVRFNVSKRGKKHIDKVFLLANTTQAVTCKTINNTKKVLSKKEKKQKLKKNI